MNDCGLNDICFLIPSLDPDEKMPKNVRELIGLGAKHVLIVDDGSKEENKHFFNELKDLKEVNILVHDVNKGKGRALKTAFSYIVENMLEIKGVVMADADGQHAPDDVIKCADVLLKTNNIVFGTRNFNEEIVPFKSRNGNKITSVVFKLLYGKWVNDTQTGLRGLPIDYLPTCIKLEGERFEYEIAMLIKIVEDGKKIEEVPIKTIYFESNRATHFNTFKDSFKIYKVMFKTFFKYMISSLLSFLIDITLYTLLFNLVFNKAVPNKAILYSTILARVVSSLFNYLCNRNAVFKSKTNAGKTVIEYYILAICQMLVSSYLVSFVFSKLSINTSIIKLFVDAILFIVSYQIQHKYIFKE